MELRLLVEHPKSSTAPYLTLDGVKWSLTEPLDVSSNLPDYTCISYVWGSGRAPHPLTTAFNISDRTLPVLAATIRNASCRRIWIDAFCIPPNQPETRAARAATLESMGFIYGRATQVVAVLSRNTYEAFIKLNQSDRLDEYSLDVLEQDEWITSVWTYQEVINSRMLWFICEDQGVASPIMSDQVINDVGSSLMLYRKTHGITTPDVAEKFPRLSTLEDLIADRYSLHFHELTAMQVLSNMDRRIAREPKSRFYSMIGAVSDKRSQRSSQPSTMDLAEAFMTACEERNDFSFIFSAANRDTLSGKAWRPVAGFLPSILPWHTSGEKQRAHKGAEGLWLDGVQRLKLASEPGHSAKQKIAGWMRRPEVVGMDDNAIAKRVYNELRRMGFTGSQEYLVTEDGMFFPQHPLLTRFGATVIVSTTLYWAFGAPGLAQIVGESAISYTPGILVGCKSNLQPSSVLLEVS